MFKFLKRTIATVLVLYLALFALTKVIRYPEPISAIKLGLAPASKTPDLMPAHFISPAKNPTPWAIGKVELPQSVNYAGQDISLDQFFNTTKTNAFLVIKDGKLVYERYFNGKKTDSLLPTYSMAKTLTSIMIGQLITEGKLKESDTFVSILPEYKTDTDFDQITIKNLLDMNSGIGVSDNYPSGPSGWGQATRGAGTHRCARRQQEHRGVPSRHAGGLVFLELLPRRRARCPVIRGGGVIGSHRVAALEPSGSA